MRKALGGNRASPPPARDSPRASAPAVLHLPMSVFHHPKVLLVGRSGSVGGFSANRAGRGKRNFHPTIRCFQKGFTHRFRGRSVAPDGFLDEPVALGPFGFQFIACHPPIPHSHELINAAIMAASPRKMSRRRLDDLQVAQSLHHRLHVRLDGGGGDLCGRVSRLILSIPASPQQQGDGEDEGKEDDANVHDSFFGMLCGFCGWEPRMEMNEREWGFGLEAPNYERQNTKGSPGAAPEPRPSGYGFSSRFRARAFRFNSSILRS